MYVSRNNVNVRSETLFNKKSDLDIYHLTLFQSLFGLLYWTVNANATSIIIALIINFTFLLYFCPLFYNHHEYPILDYHV